MKNMLGRIRNRKGQGLVEYGILIGGVALVCLAATAVLGHKTNDLISVVAGVLPGAHADDNGPIISGKLVQTTDANGGIALSLTATGGTMSSNLGITNVGALVLEAE